MTLTDCTVVQATGNDGEAALRETGSINRSLFTLGQVLAGLSMRRTSFRSATTAFLLLSHGHAMCVLSTMIPDEAVQKR